MINWPGCMYVIMLKSKVKVRVLMLDCDDDTYHVLNQFISQT